MKNKILLLFLFCLVISLFSINNQKVIAQDSCAVSGQVSTRAGNINGLDDFRIECSGQGYYFSVSSESGVTIEASGSTPIIMEGGVGPYTWEINTDGYSWDPTSGVTIEETPIGSRTNVLYCDSGTCGWTTVTVTDACGMVDTAVILNTAGTLVDDGCVLGSCGTIMYGETWGDYVGKYRYMIQFKGGTSGHLTCNSEDGATLLANYIAFGFDPNLVGCNASNYIVINGSSRIRLYRIFRYVWGCP